MTDLRAPRQSDALRALAAKHPDAAPVLLAAAAKLDATDMLAAEVVRLRAENAELRAQRDAARAAAADALAGDGSFY